MGPVSFSHHATPPAPPLHIVVPNAQTAPPKDQFEQAPAACPLGISDILGLDFDSSDYILNATDARILCFLWTLSGQSKARLGDILKGAFTILPDQGAFYKQVAQGKGPFEGLLPYKRLSSHRSKAHELGVVLGPVLGSMLVGTKKKTGHTWFQLENAPWGDGASWTEKLRHSKDYVVYLWSGKSQGPLGTSNYTEKRPLVLATVPLRSP